MGDFSYTHETLYFQLTHYDLQAINSLFVYELIFANGGDLKSNYRKSIAKVVLLKAILSQSYETISHVIKKKRGLFQLKIVNNHSSVVI